MKSQGHLWDGFPHFKQTVAADTLPSTFPNTSEQMRSLEDSNHITFTHNRPDISIIPVLVKTSALSINNKNSN